MTHSTPIARPMGDPGQRPEQLPGASNAPLSLLALAFALLSASFFPLLILLRLPFPFYPLMSYQDVADHLTPMVLIPIYWLLFRFAASIASRWVEELAFMLLAALWVLGHGIHLAANSINNLAEGLIRRQGAELLASPLYPLIYFLDEHLSHILQHLGLVGLIGLLLYREWRQPAGSMTIWWATSLAAIVYGITYFCVFLEGQTVLLGLPFAGFISLLTLRWGRTRLARQPLLAFFGLAMLLALALFIGWGLLWRSFPQFSEVGWI